MPTIYDAVIVGAGPAGSSAASALAKAGWHTLLLESDHFPRHKVCGEFLSPEAQSTLQSLELYDAVAAHDPVPIEEGQLTARSGRTLPVELPGRAWGISRYALDAALAAAATGQGAEFRTGTRVTRWQESNEIFTVELSGQGNRGENGAPSRIEARALLLACGRHAAKALLPRAAKQHHRQRRQQPYTRNVGIKRHYTGLDMPAQVEIYLIPGGYVGVNPVENGAANVCVLASYDAFARASRSPAGLIAAAAGWNPAFAERIRNGKSVPGTECSVGAVDTRRRATAWDVVPLLGDTAAMIPPLFGDGMAMALRSAELCAPLVGDYLRGKVSWREMGYHYRHRWHEEFDRRLRMGRLLERALLRRTTTKLLLQAGEKLPALADYFVRATRGAPNQEEKPRLQWPDSRLDR